MKSIITFFYFHFSVMFDTVRLKLNVENGLSLPIVKILESCKRTTDADKTTGGYYFGYHCNLKVWVHDNFITIEGSLPKYYYGNNVQSISFSKFPIIIKKLSNELHIDLSNAHFLRMDIGITLKVKIRPDLYYRCFGELQLFTRVPYSTSLYYTNTLSELNFYDKRTESQKKRMTIPPEYYDSELLRYERRLHSKFLNAFGLKFLKQNMVFVKDVYDKRIFSELIKIWLEGYRNIHKIPKMNFASGKIENWKTLRDQLAVMGVEYLGGIEECLNMIERAKYDNSLLTAARISKTKRSIKKLNRHPLYTRESEDIIELNHIIEEECIKIMN